MKKFNFIMLAVFSALVFSCNNPQNNDTDSTKNADSTANAASNEEVNLPAFENLDVAYSQHEYIANQEFKFQTETGSEIKIPKNAFKDENGNPVEGNVDVQYREIKSVAEIILSGVDMKYEKDGKIYDFQTAGMFDIRAFSNGKPVFLNEGKEIEVTFASNVKGDYDFFYYNENDKNWAETDYGKIEITEDTGNQINFELPKPVKLDPSSDLVIEIKANYKKFPELALYKGMIWKYAGNKTKDEVMSLLSKTWNGSELNSIDKKNNLYKLSLITGKKTYDLEVSPVFSEAQYKKAMAIYEKQKQNASLQDAEFNVKRTTNISQLGLYNYDVVHSSDRMIVQSDFKIKNNEQALPVETLDFFHITGNNDVVVRYTHKNKSSVYFSPSANNKIVAILPGNKVAVLTAKEFENIAKKLQNNNLSSHSFELSLVQQEIKSASDLDAIIAQL